MQSLLQVSEIQISYFPVKELTQRPIIRSSQDAYQYLIDFFPQETIGLQESFVVMYVNRSNRVLGVYKHSVGGIHETITDIRLILGTALKIASCGLIIAHNHPSGSVEPSQNDIGITQKIRDASKFLDIKLLDHLIVSSEYGLYYSFADEGI